MAVIAFFFCSIFLASFCSVALGFDQTGSAITYPLDLGDSRLEIIKWFPTVSQAPSQIR